MRTLSTSRGTLYVGSTSDLARRMHEHKSKSVAGFTKTYGVDRLVWFEIHEELAGALLRERQMKSWRRAWKIVLVERANPQWEDLTDTIGP